MMMMNGNGSYKNEIQEEQELESIPNSRTRGQLGEFIPIYMPGAERGLTDQNRQEKQRFFDFLRASPSIEWFNRSLARRSANTGGDEPAGDQEQAATVVVLQQQSRRFRVPFVRKINWSSMMKSFKKWIKDPGNIAMFIWLVLVVIGIIVLGLVMLGVFPDGESRRKNWEEVLNQIVNALFMIMCVYQQPRLFHHLVLACRWRSEDKWELRKTYCKDTSPKPHERAHLLFVIVLLHITFASQYVLCGLFWGYSRKARPDWAVDVALGFGIGAPIIAGVYIVKSPLGKRYESETTDEEARRQEVVVTLPANRELKLYNRGVVVTSPEWVGGLFDCCDDVTVACLSFFCMFCVFGWNVERLGFGSMYVHIFTFIMFCIAPFLVFSATALSVEDDTVRYVLGIIGILLCFFGLLYGGFWRIQMRKKFKLPENRCCCGYPSATDCLQWFFCWSCALAQEVRTGNFYDIEDSSFYRSVVEQEGGRLVIGEGGAIEMSTPRSHSCPPKLGTTNGADRMLPLSFERASTYDGHVHPMQPPLPNLVDLGKERLEETKEERNRWTVVELYEALKARDVEAVHRLLAPDIEWWFHGPPGFQHMMRLLTGISSHLPFDFVPLSVEPFFDHTVLVEGCDNSGSVFWVHAWSVSENGVITQVREYFNTCLTVTCVAFSSGEPPVWNSRLPETAGKSLPGLVLAI